SRVSAPTFQYLRVASYVCSSLNPGAHARLMTKITVGSATAGIGSGGCTPPTLSTVADMARRSRRLRRTPGRRVSRSPRVTWREAVVPEWSGPGLVESRPEVDESLRGLVREHEAHVAVSGRAPSRHRGGRDAPAFEESLHGVGCGQFPG